jgi:hypothetical protein
MNDKLRIKELELEVEDLKLQLEAKEGMKNLLTHSIERRAENAESERDYWKQQTTIYR